MEALPLERCRWGARPVGGVGRGGRVERGRAGECRTGCASLGLLGVALAARAGAAEQSSIPSKPDVVRVRVSCGRCACERVLRGVRVGRRYKAVGAEGG